MNSTAKLANMVSMGRSDNDTLDKNNELEDKHRECVEKRNLAKKQLISARTKYYNAREKCDNISLLEHPIKKVKAIRMKRDAKNLYRTAKKDYAYAKEKLKASQQKVKLMRRSIRKQYSAVCRNEEIIQKVRELRSHGVYIPFELSNMLDRRISSYNNEIFHVDDNPVNNTGVGAPIPDMMKSLRGIYRDHRRNMRREKVEGAVENVKSLFRNIRQESKKEGTARENTEEPEIEL